MGLTDSRHRVVRSTAGQDEELGGSLLACVRSFLASPFDRKGGKKTSMDPSIYYVFKSGVDSCWRLAREFHAPSQQDDWGILEPLPSVQGKPGLDHGKKERVRVLVLCSLHRMNLSLPNMPFLMEKPSFIVLGAPWDLGSSI